MKKNILFLLIAFLIYSDLISQINKDGIPLITEYTDKDYGEAGQVWAIEQDKRGVMYFGCNYGLKTYDGKTWKSYNNPYSTIVKSLAVGDDGIVYYGAESDFGMLIPDSIGDLQFHSFYVDKFDRDSVTFTSVWKTTIAENKVFFQSFNELFYCELPIVLGDDNKIKNNIFRIKPNSLFHLSFAVNNEFYIREWENGLCKIVDNKLELIPGGEKFASLRIYTILPFDDNKFLIGTREEGFFLYDKSNISNPISKFNVGNNTDIINAFLYSGEVLQNGNYVIGTFADGIFIFDKKGNIINHYNDKIGLPKATFFAMFFNDNDPNAQLWFAYPDYGIYRLDVSGPFTKWNNYNGIEGVVNDIIRFNGKLYAASDNSLYVLDEGTNVSFKKIYSEQQNIWKFLEFDIENSNEKKLLMASVSGLYEVKDTIVNKIADFNNAISLFQSIKDKNNLYVGSGMGLSRITFDKGKWVNIINKKEINKPISSIIETDSLFAIAEAGIGVNVSKDFDKEGLLLDEKNGLKLLGQDIFLEKFKDTILVINGAGFYQILGNDSIIPFPFFGNQYCDGSTGVYGFAETNNGYWMSVYNSSGDNPNHRLVRFVWDKDLIKDTIFAKLIPQKSTFCIYPDNEYVWVSNEKGLYKFNSNINNNYDVQYNTIITKVTTLNDSVLFGGNYIEKTDSTIRITNSQTKNLIPVLKFKDNVITFNWAAPFFVKENKIEFSYRLVGHSNKWSKWNVKNDTRYTNLNEGDYTFEVKAKNIYNIESSVASYSFSILPPWYRTIWAYILFTILGILGVLLIIKLYTKKLKRENEKLEQIVKERTAEIRQQNEEITAQRDEIHAQKEEVEKAKDKIEKQKESIMDSIHYASRIQEAVLPPEDYLNNILGEHFVLFKPRDIVSGDFYWATQRGSKTVIVAADCTGHGVPGAFMSMLGMSFLNEIVNKEGILQANIILNRLRENVKRSLRQTGKENEAKDGMDLALCIIDTEEMKLQFAGAYNPLYLLRNNEIIRVKADRMPIGIYLREKESFTNNIVDLQKGDLLYIFSDGYVDQFGGKQDSKIKSAKFKQILIENSKKSMEQQKTALANFLEDWMNNYDKKGRKYSQIDDILVIGIEI